MQTTCSKAQNACAYNTVLVIYGYMHKAGYQQHGFTIVELLVVIVVIGILAAITVVSYTGISQKAIVAMLQSDLGNSAQKLKLYRVEHDAYPATLDGSNCTKDSTGAVDTNYCLKPSSGNTFAYSSSSPYSTFTLTATNTNGTSYQITDSSGPVAYVNVPIVVTGGTVTTDGAYTVRTFTGGGTLTVTGGTITGAQVLVVGGGGGGGDFGGGGAGGYLTGTETLTGSMTVTVGDGGGPGLGGSNSVFGTRTAEGGGHGGYLSSTADSYNGHHGGSGGGGGNMDGAYNAGGYGTGESGQGNQGGAGFNGATSGGGGGGAASAGGSAAYKHGGDGGAGVNSDIVLHNTNVGYAGGGGGTASTGGSGAGAATHGGGAGNTSGSAATSGTVNTGGGGGATYNGTIGAGGSGIVIIRYLTP